MENCWILSRASNRKYSITGKLVPVIMFCCVFAFMEASISSGRAVAEDAKSLLNEADSALQKQEGVAKTPVEQTIPTLADQLTHQFHMTQEKYKLYECALLALFALVALVIVMRYLCSKPNCSSTHLVNASGLVFIIFGTLLLVLLADVDEQLNAGIGILGAVAGYLFGTMRRMESEEKPEPQKP